MVEIITGEKGKGKTRVLLDKVHEDLKKCGGSLIFIDKNNHHMFDLDSKVRLINMEDFDMSTLFNFEVGALKLNVKNIVYEAVTITLPEEAKNAKEVSADDMSVLNIGE